LNYDTAIEEYLHWLLVEKGRSPATIESYRRDLESLTAFLKDHMVTLAKTTEGDLESYYQALRKSDYARSSVNRSMSSARGWFSFLVNERLLKVDPSSRLQSGKRARSLPKPLSEDVVGSLLDSVDGTLPNDLRDRAILEFLYGTGVRVSELIGVRIRDVDFDECLVTVTGKGSKQRLVPLGRSLQRALQRYLRGDARGRLLTDQSKDFVFLNSRGGPLTRQGIDLIIHKRALATGINPNSISAHVFRHSCATHMLAHGADIRVVQELLGHASIATTQVYTGVSISTLRDSYQQAHPRAIE